MRPSLLALTLIGCIQEGIIGENKTEIVDRDDDGFAEADDCDDLDPLRYPGNPERCDGIDNDCDELIDGSVPDPADPVEPTAVCERTQTFTQSMHLDVLFVIDDSNTMLDAQQQLADGIDDLLQWVLGPGFDTHVGAVTTDMEMRTSAGKLIAVDGYSWADDEMPIPIDRWMEQALIPGIDGSGVERPLDAILAALDGRNPGFHRPDAHLSVVILSDEADSSEATPMQFLDTFYALAGQGGASVHGLVHDGESCRQTIPATGLISVIEATGGLQESICSPDYGTFLSPVGQTSAQRGLNRVFELETPAQLGSTLITVQYPGGLTTSYDDFALAPEGDAVILLGTPPPAGSRITVRWLAEPGFVE